MVDTPKTRQGGPPVLRLVTAYLVFGALWILFSDRATAALFTDPAQVTFVSTLKGWAFVAVTALLLFHVLNRYASPPLPVPHEAPTRMRRRHVAAAFALLCIGIAAAGWFVFDLMAGSIQERHHRELAAVTELKITQLDQYLRERRGNLQVYSNIPVLKQLLAERPDEDSIPYRTINRMLDLARSTYGFVHCEVTDTDGRTLVQSGEPRRDEMPATSVLAAAVEAPGPVLIDLFQVATGQLRFGYAVAVRGDADHAPVGFLLFLLDPARRLFPLLEWPVPSRSGEILLVRRDGNDGVLLNNAQHYGGRALSVNVSFAELEARVLSDRWSGQPLFAGRDYRGVPVLSALREMVEPAKWLLVAKIDESEAYEGIRQLAVTATGLIAAAMLAGGMLIVMAWRQQRLQAALAYAAQQKALKTAEEHFRAAFEQAAVGMALLSPEGGWLQVNDRLCAITGYSRPELLRLRFQDITHPDDLQADLANVERLLQGSADQYAMEKRYIRKDGSTIWINLTAALTRDEHSRPAFFISIIEDITARKEAERAQRASEADFQLLVENAPDAVFIQTGGRFVYANAAAARLFGARRTTELIGQSVLERFHPDFRATVAERIRLLNEDCETVPVLEERVLRMDSTPVDVEVNAVPFAFKGENGALVFARDISKRREAEAGLRALAAELEARVADRTARLEFANRELEAFTYSVSHDLRAPLRAIDGFSRILEEDYTARLDVEGNRLLDVVRANAQRMDRLISDLLQLSRVSRGEIKSEPVDISAMIHPLFLELTQPDERERTTLVIGPLPPVSGDPGLLRQVWANLLSNAVKYSRPRPAPQIEVGGRCEAAETVFWVRDNGVGFNPAYAHKLFSVFQRLHTAGEFEGTGVGLALVQRIVQRHGGRVWAEGRPDGGAVFYFSLPTKGDAHG